MKKIYLWLALAVLLVSFTGAITRTQIAKTKLNQIITDANYRGMSITVNVSSNITLVNVSLNKSSTAGVIRIYNYSTGASKIKLGNCSTQIQSTPLVVFSCNIPLRSGKKYFIIPEAVSGSGSITQYYNQTGSTNQTPIYNSKLTWKEAIYYSSTWQFGNNVFVWGLQSVGVSYAGGSSGNQTPTPTGLTNTSQTKHHVSLSWSGHGSIYNIYRNGSWVANTSSLNYTVHNLTDGTKYSFKIKAHNASYTTTLSNFSNQILVKTLGLTQLPTPVIVHISNTTSTITANCTGSGTGGYWWYKNDSYEYNGVSNQYTYTGLTNNTKYGLTCLKYNAVYDLPYSNVSNRINITTQQIPPSPALTLKTAINQGENYTTNPFIYRFNGTLTGEPTNDTFNCTLYQCEHYPDASCNNPNYNLGYKSVNITNKQNITFDTTDWWGWINLTLYCKNTNNVNTSLERDVFIDTVQPDIILTSGLNNSRYYRKVNTQLPFIIRFDDANLYKTNVTLCASASGTTCTQQISNWNSQYLNDPTRYVNVTNLLSSLPMPYSRYYIFAEAWDGHTAQKIKEYKLDSITNAKGKGHRINNAIEIVSPDVETFDMVENYDRYNFEVTTNKNTDQIKFYITSNGNLSYLTDSKYPGHFVDIANNKWIDFVSTDTSQVTVRKESDYEYEVTVRTKAMKSKDSRVYFESIGDLNHNAQYYYFNVSNSTTVRAKDRITNTDIQNITVKVYTYPNTLVQQKSTTNYNVSFNLTSGTYYLNISGNSGGVDYSTNVTANHTFTPNSLYTTYLTLTNSLYLFIYDEQTNQLIDDRNVTVNVINYQNVSSSYTTATGSLFQADFASGSYEINYQADNYTARSYYTTVSGGNTQTLDLYLLLDTDTSHDYVNYDIVDESAAPLSNATLKMQRYFIDENIWKTVEMSITNDQGKGFVFAELYDAPYRFIVEYPSGVTKKISSQFKLDGRDLFFSISLLDIGLTNYYSSGNVATTLSYSNATKIWTYSFNGQSESDVQSGTFVVSRQTATAKTTICNTTVSASSGGMTCNLTSYYDTDGTFLGQGYVRFASDDLNYLLQAESITLKVDHLKYGMTGVYLGMLVVGTMAFIGLFSPVGSIIMAVFGLIITNVMGLVYMNYTWFIGIIIVALIYMFSVRDR